MKRWHNPILFPGALRRMSMSDEPAVPLAVRPKEIPLTHSAKLTCRKCGYHECPCQPPRFHAPPPASIAGKADRINPDDFRHGPAENKPALPPIRASEFEPIPSRAVAPWECTRGACRELAVVGIIKPDSPRYGAARCEKCFVLDFQPAMPLVADPDPPIGWVKEGAWRYKRRGGAALVWLLGDDRWRFDLPTPVPFDGTTYATAAEAMDAADAYLVRRQLAASPAGQSVSAPGLELIHHPTKDERAERGAEAIARKSAQPAVAPVRYEGLIIRNEPVPVDAWEPASEGWCTRGSLVEGRPGGRCENKIVLRYTDPVSTAVFGRCAGCFAKDYQVSGSDRDHMALATDSGRLVARGVPVLGVDKSTLPRDDWEAERDT